MRKGRYEYGALIKPALMSIVGRTGERERGSRLKAESRELLAPNSKNLADLSSPKKSPKFRM